MVDSDGRFHNDRAVQTIVSSTWHSPALSPGANSMAGIRDLPPGVNVSHNWTPNPLSMNLVDRLPGVNVTNNWTPSPLSAATLNPAAGMSVNLLPEQAGVGGN